MIKIPDGPWYKNIDFWQELSGKYIKASTNIFGENLYSHELTTFADLNSYK